MQLFGSSWADAAPPWDFSGDIFQKTDFVEMRIPRSDLGYPVTVKLHLCMLNEQNMSEWTYAGVPSTSFVDGVDPNYGKYFSFDLTSPKKPKDYVPLP